MARTERLGRYGDRVRTLSEIGPGGFRRLLAGVAGVGALGVALDLVLIGHWHTPTQLVGLAASAALAAASFSSLTNRTRGSTWIIRITSLAVALSGAVGSIAHIAKNRAFAAELHSDWSPIRLWWAGLEGRIPGLAPLVLAQLALLLFGSTLGRRAGGVSPGPSVATATPKPAARPQTTPTLDDQRWALIALAGIVVAADWRVALVGLATVPLFFIVSVERAQWSTAIAVLLTASVRHLAGFTGLGQMIVVALAMLLLFDRLPTDDEVNRPGTRGGGLKIETPKRR